MAAYIRNNYPTVFTGIVNIDAGVAGGSFVVRDAATNKITLAASNSAWEDVYLVIDVRRNEYIQSDDATATAPKGALVAMVHPLPNDEYSINTSLTTTVGSKLGLGASGALAANGTLFEVTGTAPLFGAPAVQVRCIERPAT